MGKEIIAEIYFEIIMKSWKSWLIIFSSKGLLLKIFVYIYGFKYLFGTIWDHLLLIEVQILCFKLNNVFHLGYKKLTTKWLIFGFLLFLLQIFRILIWRWFQFWISSARWWTVEVFFFLDTILIGSKNCFTVCSLSFSFEIERRLWLVQNGNLLCEHCLVAKYWWFFALNNEAFGFLTLGKLLMLVCLIV